MKRRPLLLLLGLTLNLALAAPAAADEVILAPGATIKAPGNRVRGTIASETPTEVKIGSQTIPVGQIDDVRYDGQPPSLVQAATRERAGALADAAELYQKAASEASDKALIARDAQFRRARILAELAEGDPSRADQAADALEGFLKANPRSRQLGPALEALARLYLARGDFDKAAKALKDLNAVPWAADRAAVLQARVLTKRGQPDQAVAALDKQIAGAPEGSARRREALLARAEALAALKRFDEAEKSVRAVIDAAPAEDAEVQALAHNTLGDCLRAAGKPRDALFAYLQTEILYEKDKEQRARALAQIAQLWRELRREDRADEAVERLKQDYPNSPWLAVATGQKK